MKTKRLKLVFGLIMVILIRLLFYSIPVIAQGKSGSVPNNNGREEIMKAYNLRMNGKTDEAKAMLEAIIKKDSTNAMAYYELARLQHYMLIGQGNVKLDDIIISSNKAAANEPRNVIYAYFRSITCFLNAYISMEQGQEQGKAKIEETCKAFEKVLDLNPGYCEALLYLTEIYGMLPKEVGGDSLKAVDYAKRVKKLDPYFGAKAEALFLSEKSDQVKYWESFLNTNKKNPDLLMEVGKAYLYKDDPSNAEKYFTEARTIDPEKNILILDLARYHLMTTMQNKDLIPTEFPIAKKLVEEYLHSVPEPVLPLRAYSTGLKVLIERFQGNQVEADKLMAEAKSMDPYFSQAMGIPTLLLFDPPDKVCHHYFSFFKPF
jgi:tetratricopeptide (TPR) repeat protein